MYHKTLTKIMETVLEDVKADREKKTCVMVATHNEDTIRFAVKK